MASKAARLKRRHAARLRRIKRLRKAGRLPVHTRTERKRQEREWQAMREARRRRARQRRRAARVAVGAVGAGVMLGAWTTQTAAAPPRPAAQNYYRTYLARQEAMARPDRNEPLHDDGPDITQDGWAAPYLVTGTASYPFADGSPMLVLTQPSSSYGPAWFGRQDDLPHNEFPEPTPYAGDAPYMGTAPTSGALARLRPSGLPAWDVERYEVSW